MSLLLRALKLLCVGVGGTGDVEGEGPACAAPEFPGSGGKGIAGGGDGRDVTDADLWSREVIELERLLASDCKSSWYLAY